MPLLNKWEKHWRARVEFKKQVCWIGAYWTRLLGDDGLNLHVWICLVPMFPLHIWSAWDAVDAAAE